MSPWLDQHPDRLSAARWLSSTQAKRRRDRLRRLAEYRAFGCELGWSVLGLHQSLTDRHPVAPLLGAFSAQAELAFSGSWGRWPAQIASVVVRHQGGRESRRRQETAVQLTILETGPLGLQFTAASRATGLDVESLMRVDQAQGRVVGGLLALASERPDLRPGDHLAADELGLVHTRPFSAGRPTWSILEPLPLLSSVVEAMCTPTEVTAAERRRGAAEAAASRRPTPG